MTGYRLGVNDRGYDDNHANHTIDSVCELEKLSIGTESDIKVDAKDTDTETTGASASPMDHQMPSRRFYDLPRRPPVPPPKPPGLVKNRPCAPKTRVEVVEPPKGPAHYFAPKPFVPNWHQMFKRIESPHKKWGFSPDKDRVTLVPRFAPWK